MEWRSVVFSGESRFCLYASDGRTGGRPRPGKRRLPELQLAVRLVVVVVGFYDALYHLRLSASIYTLRVKCPTNFA